MIARKIRHQRPVDVDPVCVCVCFELQISYCGLLYAENVVKNRSICTDSPSRPVPGLSNSELFASHIGGPTWHLGPPHTGCQKLRKTSGVSSLHQNKFTSIYVCKVLPPHSDGLNTSDFNLWGQLKILVHSAQTKNEVSFPKCILCLSLPSQPHWHL